MYIPLCFGRLRHLAPALGLLYAAASSAQEALPTKDQVVTLEEILRYAVEHAPTLAIANQELGFGDAAVEAAATHLSQNPQFSATLGPRVGGGTSFDVEVSVIQQFEIAGERTLRRAAASKHREIFDVGLVSARWEVHHVVHEAYHTTLIAREQLSAAQKVLLFAESTLVIAEKRMKAGDVGALVVRLAEGDVSQAKQAKIAAESDYLAARIKLAEAAGWPIERAPIPSEGLDEPRRAPDLDILLTKAIASQPAMQAQEAELAAARADAAVAKREARGEPFFGINYALEGGGSPAQQSITALTFGLVLPVWQKNQGERAEAQTRVKVTEARGDALWFGLRADIARGIVAVNAGADRISVYGVELLPTFQANLELLQKSFELGEIDVLQITVARERFLEIELEALNAYADYYRAVANLEAVVGSDLWGTELHAIPSEVLP